jgi:hypothetical protein
MWNHRPTGSPYAIEDPSGDQSGALVARLRVILTSLEPSAFDTWIAPSHPQ